MNKSEFCNLEEKRILELCDEFPFCDQLDGKTVLVTGGTGLIGSYILRVLLALKERRAIKTNILSTIRSEKRIAADLQDSAVQWIVQDLTSEDQLPKGIDFIFHTACPTQSAYLQTHPVEVLNDTVIGARKLLEYCRENLACHLIYVSSIEVYGQKEYNQKPTEEDDYGYLNHLSVRSCYPESKKIIESMCMAYAKEYGVDAKIARFTQTIGARINPTDNRVFVQFARSVVQNQNIVLHTEGKSSKSYVHVVDAVNALLYIACKKGDQRVFNVANKDTYISIYDLAVFVANNFDAKIDVVVEKRDGDGYAPDTMINLDTTQLEKLGWTAKTNLYEMFLWLIEALKSYKQETDK